MDTDVRELTQVTLSRPLAKGLTADVYPWDDGYVLKLFHKFGLETVRYEAGIARAVHASGLPVPRVGDIVRLGGRIGLVYERVDGPSMLDALQRQPWRVFHFARRLAEVQVEMHAGRCTAEVPAQRQRLEQKIRQAAVLPAGVQAAVLDALATMPDGDRICHGDFHPGNLLLTARGEVVIDWIDTTSGNPLADVARSTVIMLGAAASDMVRNPLNKGFVRLFHAAYLRRYFSLRPGGEEEYRRWLPIVAAARLNENVPGVEKWLVEQAKRLLG